MKNYLTLVYKGFITGSVLLLAVFAFAGNAHAATTWYVAPSGVYDDGTSTTTATTTIQAAVDAAADGDTIKIGAGTYAESNNAIVVDKSLILSGPYASVSPNTDLGSRTDEAVITTSGANTTPNTAIQISGSAHTITIEGLKFSTSASPITSYSLGNTITVQKNIFVSSNQLGMYFEQPELTFDDNLFTSGSVSEDTIQIGGDYPNASQSVSITNNTWGGITGSGALNLSNITGDISHNTFDGVQYYALLLANHSGDVTVSDNIFNNISNPDPGASNTYGAGIRTYNEGGVAENNYAGPISITNNTFSNSYLGLAVRTGSDASVITTDKNKFSNNNLSGAALNVRNSASTTLNATNNWWGTASSTEIALTVDGDVSFDPWYTDAAMTILSNAVTPEPEPEEEAPAPTPSGHRRGIGSSVSATVTSATNLPGEVLGAEITSPEIQVQINAIKSKLVILITQLISILQAEITART